MTRPFFSIVIPTYNRANYIKRAIHCVLRQSFKDFEIIVVDNNSKDNTQLIVKNFENEKIFYFKNKKNIGAIANIKKAIQYAKGKYIMLHGDDDFIIDDDTLIQVYSLFKKHAFGFARLNYLNLSFDKNRLFENKKIFEDIILKPMEKSEDIISFLVKADFSFISGVIFRNYKNAYRDIIYSETGPWFRIVFKNIYRHGGYIFPKRSIVATWSRGSASLYLLEKGKLKFENFYNEVEKVVGKRYYREFLKDDLKYRIMLMPGAKLYTGIGNTIQYARRILDVYPEYKYSFVFWIYFFITLFTPKFIFRLIRRYREDGMIKRRLPNEDYIKEYMQRIANNS